MKFVLHVPKLSSNHLSSPKITKDLNCKVIVSHSYCLFQENTTEKTIGHAQERDGLYYHEANSSLDNDFPLSYLSAQCSNKDHIWLHHFHFGHPFFRKKIMFPLLFKGLNIDSFHHEECEFAKHLRSVRQKNFR